MSQLEKCKYVNTILLSIMLKFSGHFLLNSDIGTSALWIVTLWLKKNPRRHLCL